MGGRVLLGSNADSRPRELRKMESGTVIFYSGSKGYGFIAPDAGGAHVFVHVNDLELSGITMLTEKQKVFFERKQDAQSGKWLAVNIRPA